jgi:hypothetical protein
MAKSGGRKAKREEKKKNSHYLFLCLCLQEVSRFESIPARFDFTPKSPFPLSPFPIYYSPRMTSHFVKKYRFLNTKMQYHLVKISCISSTGDSNQQINFNLILEETKKLFILARNSNASPSFLFPDAATTGRKRFTSRRISFDTVSNSISPKSATAYDEAKPIFPYTLTGGTDRSPNASRRGRRKEKEGEKQ